MDAKKLIERARTLEKGGQGEAAAKAFREAGAVEEAARVLGTLRRPRDAAQLLLDSVGVQPAQAGSYRVVVNNYIDAVVSGPAFLTVAQEQLTLKPGEIRDEDALGMTALQSRRIFQVLRAHTSRITGMINGRRDVSFTM